MISKDRDWMLLSLFIYEVKSLTDEIDLRRLDLESQLKFEDTRNTISSIKMILLISAQLSFIFHPINRHRERAVFLRRAFNLDSDIDLLGDRKIRNHIAHMDERLHDWHNTSRSYNIFRGVVGSRNGISGPGFSEDDIFEQYIPEEGIFAFRGEEYDLRRLLQTSQKLNKRACALSSHHWSSREFQGIFKDAACK